MLFRLNLKFARLDYQGMNNEPILLPSESEQTHLVRRVVRSPFQ